MDSAQELRGARRRAGLTQAQLAAAAGTSQASISAYEAGRKQPSVATLGRLLEACGARLEVRPPARQRTRAQLERAGRHLGEVIALAEALPYRPRRTLDFPRLTP
jgi:transcriptional regulator with XRE-family HTH domain